MNDRARHVACAVCGKAVDPWRAPRVRFTAGAQFFFCSAEHADGFHLPAGESLEQEPESSKFPRAAVSASSSTEVSNQTSSEAAPSLREPLLKQRVTAELLASEQEALQKAHNRELAASVAPARADDSSSPRLTLKSLSALGSQSPVLQMVGEEVAGTASSAIHASSEQVASNRPLSSVDEGASFRAEDDSNSARQKLGEQPVQKNLSNSVQAAFEGDLLSLVSQLIPLTLLAVAVVALNFEEKAFWPAASAWGLLLFILLVERKLFPTLESSSREFFAACEQQLQGQARLLREGAESFKLASQVRAGEELRISAGETLLVDGVVSSGSGQLLPWFQAQNSVGVQEGDRVIAGAQLISGEMSVIASKGGEERAFALLHRTAGSLNLVRVSRGLSLLAGPALSLLATGLLALKGLAFWELVAIFAGLLGAFSSPLCRRIQLWSSQRSIRKAALRGMTFSRAQVLDSAAQVSTAIFCARGTVLHGEPEVAEVHVFREMSEAQLLSLAAGAESVVHHPIASATLRAAHARKASVDACRGHHVSPGMGVVCSSSRGQALVVGSRELLLRERVSVALAEETLRSLEVRGMSTLLIAVDGHLAGVLGLQDSLRAGARATFQLLLDAGIEPILLSGDSRATTEAVAHSLSCEHVRPEVPVLARAAEVHSFSDGGAVVAVIGCSPRDDVALSAAPVPIVLDGAAIVRADSPHAHERGIGLVGGHVQSSAWALLAARHIHRLNQVALMWCLVPTLVAALLVGSQLISVFWVPAAALLSSFVAFRYVQYLDKRASWHLPG